MKQVNNLNLDALKQAEFKRAKDWWFKANVSNTAVVLFGLVANIWPGIAPAMAILSAILVGFTFISQWVSDLAKENAEWLLRQFEMWNGMGWPINERELCNTIANIPVNLRNNMMQPGTHKYFDSRKKKSPQRVADNFIQSAFYTKYQSRFISKIILLVGVGIILFGGLLAIVALQQTQNADGNVVAYIVIALFQAVVGAGYIRLGINYWQFASTANHIEDRAGTLAKDKSATEVEAIRLAHDYQIARSNLPLIPEWVWKVKQQEINDLWLKLNK